MEVAQVMRGLQSGRGRGRWGYIADCGSLLGQQWFVAASGSDGAGAVAIGCEEMLLGPTLMQKA